MGQSTDLLVIILIVAIVAVVLDGLRRKWRDRHDRVVVKIDKNLLRAVEGVLDLTIGQTMGKKNRPVSAFQVLAAPAHAEAVMQACFFETATIGLRWYDGMRQTLSRQPGQVGSVRTKAVSRPGRETTVKAESDDLVAPTLSARRRLKQATEASS